MSQHGQSHERPIPEASPTTRRAVVCWTAKLTAGALVAAIPASRLAQTARADDTDGDGDVVILTAAGAQVSASPGSAAARSAVAEAVAERGAARVKAAAALAEADSDQGAIAQGAAATALAVPDQGATAQSASAVASASSQDDNVETPQAAPQVAAPAAREVAVAEHAASRRRWRRPQPRSRRRWRRRPRASGSPRRAAVGGERDRGRGRAGSLPSAGVGELETSSLPSVFTIASAVAALGAVVFRNRGETAQVAEAVAGNR